MIIYVLAFCCGSAMKTGIFRIARVLLPMWVTMGRPHLAELTVPRRRRP